MKFAEHLTAHLTSEWRSQYINYEELKCMISNPPDGETNRNMYLNTFFEILETELEKVNIFFMEKLAEATRKFTSLKSDLHEARTQNIISFDYNLGNGFFLQTSYKSKPRKYRSVKSVQELRLAFGEYYLSLILLQNYQALNYSGFQKILKKFDKMYASQDGRCWKEEKLDTTAFYTYGEVNRLIEDTEDIYAICLEGGDRQRALKKLRVPPLEENDSLWTTFRVGLFSGAFVTMLLSIAISIWYKGDEWTHTLSLFRATMAVITMLIANAVNVQGWRSHGVNSVLIFELNPRNFLSAQQLLEVAMVYGILWCVAILSFVHSTYLGISPYLVPLILVAACLMLLLNPAKIWYYDTRIWFMRIVARTFVAPFYSVKFAEFWFAEQLTSLVPVFSDFQCLFLSYSTFVDEQSCEECVAAFLTSCTCTKTWLNPTISALPFFIRMMQCFRRYYDTKNKFPHLANACKYASAIVVVIFSFTYSNGYLYTFFLAISMIACFVFTSYWDVKMDWGLFSEDTDGNILLRSDLLYTPAFYYFSMVSNAILRAFWLITISNPETFPLGDVWYTIFTLTEIFRRLIWNYIRLENEHLNNCGNFRVVRDISVRALRGPKEEDLIRMMDEEEGVYYVNHYTAVAADYRDSIAAAYDAVNDVAEDAKNANGCLKKRKTVTFS